ncbi:uncharacterized protein [Diabrotica undecimpunctata]|uniref:uncharacterized protein n=1 Tax=Diabrotica undecimpunctata TaxID=50387 RepID=UPI003B63C88A
MGDLPATRVQPSFPFAVTEADYAGPFLLKGRRGRGCKTYKGYVCLFICLSTKASHLELGSELSTQKTFLSASKCFISRRGKPTQLMSDNESNFTGVFNELNVLNEFFKLNKDKIKDECNHNQISWKFILCYTPHFGGIWELGVKSMKSHMKRVYSNSLLTYEDFQTILVQIEGILNSRLFSPLSNDTSDLNPLTPSHFLIGRPIISIPKVDISVERETRLQLHERLQFLQQHFWKRWSLEYISELQQRQK